MGIDRLKHSKIFHYLFIFLTINIIISVISITTVADDPTNSVYVNLEQNFIDPGESFTIYVNCTPLEPIKAYELRIIFDSEYLEALSVTEGDFFNGYTTFFNSGEIDNENGTIIKLYGLIVGDGNVSNPGSLIEVNFQAKSNIGSTQILLENVGITNEVEYLELSTQNSTVTIYNSQSSHLIYSMNPANQTQEVDIDLTQLSLIINDLEGDPFNWTIQTSPDIGYNSGNNSANGTKICNVSGLNYSTTYNWYITCQDLNTGNWTNESFWFETMDDPNQNNGGGGDNPPYYPDDDSDENSPPNKPNKPIGPTSIELGISYSYFTSSFDSDEDEIRYRFDWGDGNLSNWSDYVSSNSSIYMTHSWDNISDYEIKVICQDENEENSSWSDPLNVIISQIEIPEENDTGNESQYDIGLKINDSYDAEEIVINSVSHFLIDIYKDGIYDLFYNTEIGINTTIEYDSENVILIDIDDDSNWDYTYDLNLASLAEYGIVSEKTDSGFGFLNLWFFFGLFILIILAALIFILRFEIKSHILDLKIYLYKSKVSSYANEKDLNTKKPRKSLFDNIHNYFFSDTEEKDAKYHEDIKKIIAEKERKKKNYYFNQRLPNYFPYEPLGTSKREIQYGRKVSVRSEELKPDMSAIDGSSIDRIHSIIDNDLINREKRKEKTRYGDLEEEVDRLLYNKKIEKENN